MQRINGNAQSPLQLSRLDEEIDPGFDEELILDVIREGSAVHCISAYRDDILVLGSDGVFDNLFLDDIVSICNALLPSDRSDEPLDPDLLTQVAEAIVDASHSKTCPDPNGQFANSPIGRGGKVDDTCCVVGEVIEWTEAHAEACKAFVRKRQWGHLSTCGGTCRRPDLRHDIELEGSDEEGKESSCSVS
jgi:hypothetical protein